jgi:hypothetical protein
MKLLNKKYRYSREAYPGIDKIHIRIHSDQVKNIPDPPDIKLSGFTIVTFLVPVLYLILFLFFYFSKKGC